MTRPHDVDLGALWEPLRAIGWTWYAGGVGEEDELYTLILVRVDGRGDCAGCADSGRFLIDGDRHPPHSCRTMTLEVRAADVIEAFWAALDVAVVDWGTGVPSFPQTVPSHPSLG